MKRLVLMSVVAMVLAFSFSFAKAQTYEGIDILFLVDQSGSMGGSSYGDTRGLAAQDPDGLRFRAVEFAVDWLGSFRAQQALLDNRLDVNVAVVNFGGLNSPNGITQSAQILDTTLPWEPVSPSTLQDWDRQRESILSALSAEAFGNRNLGSTNFVSAFEEAFNLFDQRPNDNNLKVIVVLTDGEPCAPGLFNISRNCNSQIDKENHMADLTNMVNSEFGSANSLIYTIAINSDPQAFQDYFINAWETITQGRLYQLTDSRRVGQTMNEILIDLGQQMSPETDGQLTLGQQLDLRGGASFVVPPYQQLMSVTVFKTDATNTLNVTLPDGDVLAAVTDRTQTVTGTNTPIEIWRILNPEPGLWQFDVAGGNSEATASVDLLRAKSTVVLPEDGGQMYQPLNVQLQVLNDDNLPLTRYANRDFEMRGDIVATYLNDENEDDPLSVSVDLRPVTGRDASIFEASFVPLFAGEWSIALSASAQADGSDRIEVNETQTVIVDDSRFVIAQGEDTTIRRNSQIEAIEGVNVAYDVYYLDDNGERLDVVTDEMLFKLANTNQTCDDVELPLVDEDESPDRFVSSYNRVGDAQTLCLTLTIEDPTSNGLPLTVYDGAFATVNVENVEPLALYLVEPQSVQPGGQFQREDLDIDAQRWGALWGQNWLPIMPTWDAQPMELIFEVVNTDSGEAVDLFNSLESSTLYSPSDVFQFKIRDEQGVESPVQNLLPTDDPSRWRVQVSSLAVGNYRLILEAPETPIGDTNRAFLGENIQSEFSLAIVPNATINLIKIGFNVLYGGILAVIVFVLIRILWRVAHSVQNPLRGQLVIAKRTNDGRWIAQKQAAGVPAIYDLEDQKSKIQYAVPIGDLPTTEPRATRLEAKTRFPQDKGRLFVLLEVNGVRMTTQSSPLSMDTNGNPDNIDAGTYIEFDDGGEYYRLIWTSMASNYRG